MQMALLATLAAGLPPPIQQTFEADSSIWVSSSTLHHNFTADFHVAVDASASLVAINTPNLTAGGSAPDRTIYCIDGGASAMYVHGEASCIVASMSASAVGGCAGKPSAAECLACVLAHGVVPMPEESGLLPPTLPPDSTRVPGEHTFDGVAADVWQHQLEIHTHDATGHPMNVSIHVQHWLRAGTGELLHFAEQQTQVNGVDGSLISSHNESHSFHEYSTAPDPAFFAPPPGVKCSPA